MKATNVVFDSNCKICDKRLWIESKVIVIDRYIDGKCNNEFLEFNNVCSRKCAEMFILSHI